MWDDAIDDFYDLKEAEMASIDDAYTLLLHLNSLNNRTFLKYILDNSDRYSINNVVPQGRFKAYNIGEKCNKNGWDLADKQRHAITNVFLFLNCGYKQEDLI